MAQGVAARQGGKQNGQQEGVEQEVVSRMSGKCRNPDTHRLDRAPRGVRRRGLPLLVEHPSEQTVAFGCLHEQAGFSGDVAGVAGDVAAEGLPLVLEVENQQRERPQGEAENRKNHRPFRGEGQNAAWKYRYRSHTGT